MPNFNHSFAAPPDLDAMVLKVAAAKSKPSKKEVEQASRQRRCLSDSFALGSLTQRLRHVLNMDSASACWTANVCCAMACNKCAKWTSELLNM